MRTHCNTQHTSRDLIPADAVAALNANQEEENEDTLNSDEGDVPDLVPKIKEAEDVDYEEIDEVIDDAGDFDFQISDHESEEILNRSFTKPQMTFDGFLWPDYEVEETNDFIRSEVDCYFSCHEENERANESKGFCYRNHQEKHEGK